MYRTNLLIDNKTKATKRAGEIYGEGVKAPKYVKPSASSLEAIPESQRERSMQEIDAKCLLYASTIPLNDSACKLITLGLNPCKNFCTVVKLHSAESPNAGVVMDTDGFYALMQMLPELITECEIDALENRCSYNLEQYVINPRQGTNIQLIPRFQAKYGYNICLGIATLKRLKALENYIQDVINSLEKDDRRINTDACLRTMAEEAAITAVEIGEAGSLNAESLPRICSKLGPRFMDLTEIAAKFPNVLLPLVRGAVDRIHESYRIEYSQM